MGIAVDLFCGCGGMSEGLLKAGFEILFANDISDYASETYIKRHKQKGLTNGVDYVFFKGDIHDVTGQLIKQSISNLDKYKNGRNFKIDAIFGGPPCQGFSLAGKRNKDDPRNYLFKEYLRVVSEIMPDYVVVENVVGFLSTELNGFSSFDGEIYDGKNSLAPKILINEFSKIGYSTLEPKILDASDFGVPQSRKRIIFFAYKNGVKIPSYPESSNLRVTLKEAIGDLYIEGYTSSYIKQRNNGLALKKLSNNEKSKINLLTKERFALYQNGETTAAVKTRIKNNGIELSKNKKLLDYLSKNLNMNYNKIIDLYKQKNIEEKYIELLLTKKNIRKKLNPDLPSLTVVTIPDDYINPFNNSIFSVRELARLQSFDDDFVFYGKRTTGGKLRKKETPQYTQVGNAVPPLLAFYIGKSIISLLGKNDD